MVLPNEGVIGYGYTPQDWVQPKSVLFPGGVRQEFEYDGLRRLKKLTSKSDWTTYLDSTYGYTPANLISSIDTEHGKYAYSYDEGYRLTKAESPDQSVEEYTYDALGRRQPMEGTPWTYNEHGGVLSANGKTYEYDPQGNRTRAGDTKFFYDESDRLVRVEDDSGDISPLNVTRSKLKSRIGGMRDEEAI